MSKLPDPYSVTPRKRLSNKERLQMFIEHDGICCICQSKIDGIRERWIDEHELALWLGSLSDEDRERFNAPSNRGPAHERCATLKTAREATDRARGRKASERLFGAKRPKKIMPGSRRSPWKQKASGEWIRRDSE